MKWNTNDSNKENVRKAVSALIHKNKDKASESDAFKVAQAKKLDKKKDTYIITYAQNDTPVHKQFFENILAYTKKLDAGLHVIAGRYNNPTSIFSKKQKEGEVWAREVQPFLDANRHNIHKHLQVLSDVKVSPTAATPLSGLKSMTGLESCIVGHPRQHLESLPILNGISK